MTMNTQRMERTTFEPEIEVVDWLLVHINENVDWSNPFRDEEFQKLKGYVADATMQPIDCVTVDKDTDGGRLYNKLRIMAKEERLDSIVADIQFIRIDKYPHLSKARGTELAALDYAKQVHANRGRVTREGYGGAMFTCSTGDRVDRALEAHANYRKRVRVSLNKVTFR
jgi:hypothetical protein